VRSHDESTHSIETEITDAPSDGSALSSPFSSRRVPSRQSGVRAPTFINTYLPRKIMNDCCEDLRP